MSSKPLSTFMHMYVWISIYMSYSRTRFESHASTNQPVDGQGTMYHCIETKVRLYCCTTVSPVVIVHRVHRHSAADLKTPNRWRILKILFRSSIFRTLDARHRAPFQSQSSFVFPPFQSTVKSFPRTILGQKTWCHCLFLNYLAAFCTRHKYKKNHG